MNDATAEVPEIHTLPVLGAAAHECQACPHSRASRESG